MGTSKKVVFFGRVILLHSLSEVRGRLGTVSFGVVTSLGPFVVLS